MYSRIGSKFFAALKSIVALYGFPKEITLRTDNGSQFISGKLAEYVEDTGIEHEFCRVATPQQNGHVECFHSILERFIRKRDTFETFDELERTIRKWTLFYNEERIHKGCGYKTPSEVMCEYYEKTDKNIGKNIA